MRNNGYQILLNISDTNYHIEYDNSLSFDFFNGIAKNPHRTLSVFKLGDDDSRSYVSSKQLSNIGNERMTIDYLRELQKDLTDIAVGVREKLEHLVDAKSINYNLNLGLALETLIDLKIECEIESINLDDHFNNIINRVNALDERRAISISISSNGSSGVVERPAKRI